MRLLTHNDRGELYVTQDLVDDDVPPYAILSHTWGDDEEEVKFKDMGSEACRSKNGYKKIALCCQQVRRDELQHCWVDTCCIDKTNQSELSEAITSMYRWYQNAQICYVYLADVSSSPSRGDVNNQSGSPRRSWKPSFRRSRWFTRGWTLQELLAPQQVVFYSREWDFLGTKQTLKNLIHEITSIPLLALENKALSQFTVTERLRWAKGRTTKKKEDQAYCLLGIFNVYMYLNYGEGDNAFSRLIEAITDKPRVTITLRVAERATFDAFGHAYQGCHPATRVELLQSVYDWAQDTNGKSIFWLSGMAGTGKSTISWTVAQKLANPSAGTSVVLGASFFFKRGEGDRESAALLFPTIAQQLATNTDRFDTCLAQAVQADPDICSKSLGEQFKKLILEPVQLLDSSAGHRTYVIIIDALDECNSKADIRTILQLWSRLSSAQNLRLRLFLTSRPELDIRVGFKKMAIDLHLDLILHKVAMPTIQHDILAYLTDALAEVRRAYNLALDDDLIDEQIPAGWPSRDSLQMLTNIAVPLFIVAATIHRLISEDEYPHRCLETILRSQSKGHITEVGAIYRLVVEGMISSARGEQGISKVQHEFRVIVGAIVTLAEPLSRIALAALLEIKPIEVHTRLRSLHAVLQVSEDGNVPIRPLHLSFSEYLKSQEIQSTPYWVDEKATHASLWKQCLRLLSSSDGLRENMGCLEHPGKLLSETPPEQVQNCLAPEVRYACRYWVHHIQQSGQQLRNEDEVHVFLKSHLLHWLEALSLMNRVSEAIGLLGILQTCVSSSTSDLSAFLEDARRFVLANRYIVHLAPLQLYSSAIIFAPEGSLVRQFCAQIPSWIKQHPKTPSGWSSELQKLEGHFAPVANVTFSSDGTTLISGSFYGAIRLWDVQTGGELQTLEEHSEPKFAVVLSSNGSLLASADQYYGWDRWDRASHTVSIWDMNTGHQVRKFQGQPKFAGAMAFSPNGHLLAIGYGSLKAKEKPGSVHLWDVNTGREVQRLNTLSGPVCAMTFSPSGDLLALGYGPAARKNGSGTIILLDVHTSQEVQKLEALVSGVRAVAFSPDGETLASAHERVESDKRSGRVSLWNVRTGQEVQRLGGHSHDVLTIAFSPDSTLLASGSGDTTIRVWDVCTGQEIQKLEGHSQRVDTVAFSPNGCVLASGSADRTVRLWDIQTVKEIQKPRGHSGNVTALAFSPNFTLLASSSRDGTVRVWDAHTSQEVQTLKGYSGIVDTLAFSPHDDLLASASFNRTVRLWNLLTYREARPPLRISTRAHAMAFSSDSILLALGSYDRTVRLWNVQMGQEVQELAGHSDAVLAVAFSPSDNVLASGSTDRTVRLWDLCTGQGVRVLSYVNSSIRALTFSPDGTLLAGGSSKYVRWNFKGLALDEEVIWLWESHTGREIMKYSNLPSIDNIKFNTDSTALITNVGTFSISDHISPTTEIVQPITNNAISVRHDWVRVNNQELLWLPYEYRGESLSHGNRLVIGSTSGLVSFYEFDFNQT